MSQKESKSNGSQNPGRGSAAGRQPASAGGGRGGTRTHENGGPLKQEPATAPGPAAAKGWGQPGAGPDFASVLKAGPAKSAAAGDTAASGTANGLQFGSFPSAEAHGSEASSTGMEAASSAVPVSAAAPVPNPVAQPLPHAVAAPQQVAPLPQPFQAPVAPMPLIHAEGPRIQGQGQPQGQNRPLQGPPQSSRVIPPNGMQPGAQGNRQQLNYRQQHQMQPQMMQNPMQFMQPGTMYVPLQGPGGFSQHMAMSPNNSSFMTQQYMGQQIPMQQMGQMMPLQQMMGQMMGPMGHMQMPPPPPPPTAPHMQIQHQGMQQQHHHPVQLQQIQHMQPHMQGGPVLGGVPMQQGPIHGNPSGPPPSTFQHFPPSQGGIASATPAPASLATAPPKRVLKILDPSTKQAVPLPDKAVDADIPSVAAAGATSVSRPVVPAHAAAPVPVLAAAPHPPHPAHPAAISEAAHVQHPQPVVLPVPAPVMLPAAVVAPRVTHALPIKEPTEEQKQRAMLHKTTPPASLGGSAPTASHAPPHAPEAAHAEQPAAPAVPVEPSPAAVLAPATPLSREAPKPSVPVVVVSHAAAAPAVAAAVSALGAAVPAVKAAEPAAKVTEPVAKVTEPAAKVAEPAAKAPEPAAKAVEPVPKAAAPPAPTPAPAEPAAPTPAGVPAAACAPKKSPASVVAPAPPAAAQAPTHTPTPTPVEVQPPAPAQAPEAPAPSVVTPEASERGTASAPNPTEGTGQGLVAHPLDDAAGHLKKSSIKDIGKRADAKDEQLRERADPFLKPKPPAPAEVQPAGKANEPASAVVSAPLPPPQGETSVSDNWETAEEEGTHTGPQPTPAVTAVMAGAPEDGTHTYTRDYMKSLASGYNTRPATLDAAPWMDDFLLAQPRPFNPENYADMMGRASSASLRKGPGGGRGDEWAGSRGGGPGMGGPGGRGPFPPDARGPAGGRGSGGPPGRDAPRRGAAPPVVDDKWERGRALPPPSSGEAQGRGDRRGGGGGGGREGKPFGVLASLHRTDNRFVAGQVLKTDDPEEEKRQKSYQGILNKITPDNFDILTRKMLEEVGVTEMRSLEGLIEKIFDKALTDVHFSELYAQMCQFISKHPLCPKFESLPSADGKIGKPIDLRRLLLNKCQVEFENGCKAMASVAEREAKGEVVDEDKEKEGEITVEAAPLAEGEVAPEGAEGPVAPVLSAADEEKAARIALRKAAEADRSARRRMLGNIQFVGYLFKEGLLTERIMHGCMAQLLKEEGNPRAEDVECLCKLLSTVGQLLDRSTREEQKLAMPVYYKRIEALKKNEKLDSRIRFMVQDVLDLRANNWVPRTKKEGPKKIADVHREAKSELMMQVLRDREEIRRGPDRRGGGGGGRRDDPPPQRRDFDRMLNRDDVPNRTIQMQRSNPAAEQSFRPSGKGFGAQQPARTASPAAPRAGPAPLAVPVKRPAARAEVSAAPTPAAPTPLPKSLTLEETETSVNNIVKEFYLLNGRSTEATLASLAELRSRGGKMGRVVELALKESLEQRGLPMEERIEPFRLVFKAALEFGPEDGGLTAEEVEEGSAAFVSRLQVVAEEMPKAVKLMAHFFGSFVAEDKLPLISVLGSVLEGEAEEEGGDPPLVDSGEGQKWLLDVIKTVVGVKGEEASQVLWAATGLSAANFFASFMKDEEKQAACAAAGLGWLLPA